MFFKTINDWGDRKPVWINIIIGIIILVILYLLIK